MNSKTVHCRVLSCLSVGQQASQSAKSANRIASQQVIQVSQSVVFVCSPSSNSSRFLIHHPFLVKFVFFLHKEFFRLSSAYTPNAPINTSCTYACTLIKHRVCVPKITCLCCSSPSWNEWPIRFLYLLLFSIESPFRFHNLINFCLLSFWFRLFAAFAFMLSSKMCRGFSWKSHARLQPQQPSPLPLLYHPSLSLSLLTRSQSSLFCIATRKSFRFFLCPRKSFLSVFSPLLTTSLG